MAFSFNNLPFHEIGQVVAGLLIGLIAYLFSKLKKAVKSQTLFNKPEINYNLRVVDILREIRMSLNGDRVYLFQIHNGDYYLSGDSMRKMSLSHFDTRSEISAPLHTENYYHNIPIGYLADTFHALAEKNFIFLDKIDSLKEYYLKALLRMAGNQSALVCQITGPKGLIGILIVAWIDPVQNLEILDQEITAHCNQISAEIVLNK